MRRGIGLGKFKNKEKVGTYTDASGKNKDRQSE